MTDWVEKYKCIHHDALELFTQKNADYGDAFSEYGPVGVLVRIGDKIKRLQTITSTGVTMIKDEKMKDTLLDLHNYSAMALMLIMDDTEKQ